VQQGGAPLKSSFAPPEGTQLLSTPSPLWSSSQFSSQLISNSRNSKPCRPLPYERKQGCPSTTELPASSNQDSPRASRTSKSQTWDNDQPDHNLTKTAWLCVLLVHTPPPPFVLPLYNLKTLVSTLRQGWGYWSTCSFPVWPHWMHKFLSCFTSTCFCNWTL
jgi:hypothetical protein